MALRKDNNRMKGFVDKVNGSSPKRTYGFSPPPGDIKKHEEKTSLFNTLKNTASTVMSYHPVVAAAKAGTEFIKNQIVDNLNPRSYKRPVERITDAVLGKPAPGSYANRGRGGERHDALSLMMTGEQRDDTLPVSEYSPEGNPFFKNVKKGTTYYRSPQTEAYIRETFMGDSSKLRHQRRVDRKSFDDSVKKGEGSWLNRHGGGNVLGKFTMYKGKDEKGEYIDYYDKWNLDPFERKSGTTGKILNKGATVAQNLAGIKPAEFYGRVYYDNIKNKGTR
mgnify:FL=1|tara:strand:+ start:42 stop:875 length:834 start_codon:yes stop_codon:yes gene_type:complete